MVLVHSCETVAYPLFQCRNSSQDSHGVHYLTVYMSGINNHSQSYLHILHGSFSNTPLPSPSPRAPPPLHQIYHLSVDNCGTHSSCVSCVQSANPLCGWCSTEGRCMPTDSCSTAGTFTSHNNASSCPAITNVSPEQAYIVNNETVSCTLQY